MKIFEVEHLYDLPEMLRAERKKQKKTQKQLAREAHISENTVALTEHGQTNPSIEMLASIVRALGYDTIQIKIY